MTGRIRVVVGRADIVSALGAILTATAKAEDRAVAIVVHGVGAWMPIATMVENVAGMVEFATVLVIPSVIAPVRVGVFVMKTGPPRMPNCATATLDVRSDNN